jgi:hypothetical protein
MSGICDASGETLVADVLTRSQLEKIRKNLIIQMIYYA